jgi:hypothetical protein
VRSKARRDREMEDSVALTLQTTTYEQRRRKERNVEASREERGGTRRMTQLKTINLLQLSLEFLVVYATGNRPD